MLPAVDLVFHDLRQTGFVDETAAARVERVKQEKGIFWGSLATLTLEEAKWSSLQVGLHCSMGQTVVRNSALIT